MCNGQLDLALKLCLDVHGLGGLGFWRLGQDLGSLSSFQYPLLSEEVLNQ